MIESRLHGERIPLVAACKCAATQVGLVSETLLAALLQCALFFRAKCCPKRRRDLVGKLHPEARENQLGSG